MKRIFIIIAAIAITFSGVYIFISKHNAPEPELWGYINTEGKMVIEPIFLEAMTFQEGMAAVEICEKRMFSSKKCKWGYINKTGAIVIEAEYDKVLEFSEGLAEVQKCKGENCLWGIIDKDGNWVKKPEYIMISRFSEGLAAVTTDPAFFDYPFDAKFVFINHKGHVVIDGKFKNVRNFSDSLAAANFDNKWGFINKKGEIVIEPMFDEVGPFREGFAHYSNTIFAPGVPAQVVSGYVDKEGNVHEVASACTAGTFDNGLAPVSVCEKCTHSYNCKWGLVDTDFNLVVPIQYDSIISLFLEKEWLLFRERPGLDIPKYGYADMAGKVVIEPRFTSLGYFHEGYAPACVFRECGLIDATGGFKIKLAGIIGMDNFSEGMAAVRVASKQ